MKGVFDTKCKTKKILKSEDKKMIMSGKRKKA